MLRRYNGIIGERFVWSLCWKKKISQNLMLSNTLGKVGCYRLPARIRRYVSRKTQTHGWNLAPSLLANLNTWWPFNAKLIQWEYATNKRLTHSASYLHLLHPARTPCSGTWPKWFAKEALSCRASKIQDLWLTLARLRMQPGFSYQN